jgi:hypothetical protein
MRKGQTPFRTGRRLPVSESSLNTTRRFGSRALGIAAATLPIAGAFAVATPAAVVAHAASPNTITAPTYVRTIGTNGESTMYPSGVAVDSSGNV